MKTNQIHFGSPMLKYNFYFIHGFFGQSSDWQELQSELSKNINVAEVQSLELFSPDSNLQGDFTNFVEIAPRPMATENNVLVGYSLGGRLAQHMYLQNSNLWNHAFFLSSNVGLCPEVERRKAWESEWRSKFLDMPWSELQEQWSAQDIFAHDKKLQRKEEQFDREKLANSLTDWSLLNHQFDTNEFVNLNGNIHWVYGERDLKYKGLHEQFINMKLSGTFDQIKGAGHRLLDKPKDLADLLLKYLR